MDERACIAACLICTLAVCMRDCQACPFRAGLTVKAASVKAAENSELSQTKPTQPTQEQEIKNV